jgi:crotonobetaine/carnitine-CoA ligase
VNRIDLADPDNRVLGRILRLHAQGAGDTPFLLADSEHYTYAQVNSLANRYASGLRALGVATGDRVLVFMHSCVEFVVLALAANKLGAVWVPVNTDYKGDWLADAINDSKGAALAVDGALLPRLQQVRDRVAFGHLLLHRSTPEQVREAGAAATLAELATHPDVEPDMSYQHYGDTSSVLWTSGTTGKSKGVMQSHNVWFEAALGGDVMYDTRPGDVAYNVMPMYNSGAWATSLFRSLFCGITLAIDPAFSVSHFWDRVRFYGATQSFTIGAMHMFLWNAPARPDDADNPLRELQAVPMPSEIKEPFSKRFGVKIMGQGMSQSEAMLILRQDARKRSSWPVGSCGNPVDDIDVMLADDAGKASGGARRSRGVLCEGVRTGRSLIFNGYFDDPGPTSERLFRRVVQDRRPAASGTPTATISSSTARRTRCATRAATSRPCEVESWSRCRHPAIADCAAVYGMPSQR